MIESFIHVAAGISTSFLFVAEIYSLYGYTYWFFKSIFSLYKINNIEKVEIKLFKVVLVLVPKCDSQGTHCSQHRSVLSRLASNKQIALRIFFSYLWLLFNFTQLGSKQMQSHMFCLVWSREHSFSPQMSWDVQMFDILSHHPAEAARARQRGGSHQPPAFPEAQF